MSERQPMLHTSTETAVSKKGPLAWMAQNSVAANLLMVLCLIGGLLMWGQVKKEVFPEVNLDMVTVQVPYPGAGPEEVEQGVVLSVEEAVRGVDGIDEVRSTASEGMGTVTAELMLGANPQKALNDIKSEVDRITSFPHDAERPIVSLSSSRRQVLSVVLSGDVGRHTLSDLAERVRSDLISHKNISVVEITGLPNPEISIEVSQDKLRRYNLTLQQVAQAVQAASVEIPGGSVRTDKGEVLLRTTERRKKGSEFLNIVVKSQPDGSKVTIGDIAKVIDGFAQTDREATFNGKPAVQVQVYRVGDQTPLDISKTVKDYVAHAQLPSSVHMNVWNDSSELYQGRVQLLQKNAFFGLVLVLLLLGVFLELRLAFWVTMGIPVSFLGAILLMPALDVSINMISLFAFILTLGIVVDDAIVVGEAVYKRRSETNMGKLESAIAGVREVGSPVVFSVLTTVIAFVPLLMVPGVMGKFFRNIPLIVIPILLISLAEALTILPAHLAHVGTPAETGVMGAIHHFQQKVSNLVERFVDNWYYPAAKQFLRYRYVTLAFSFGLLFITVAFVASGRIKFTFMPKIEGDQISASVEMPFGTSVDNTKRVVDRLVTKAQQVLNKEGHGQDISRGIYADIGTTTSRRGPMGPGSNSGSHLAQVTISLVPADERKATSAQITKAWREAVGDVAGVESLQYNYSIGASAGAPVSVELRHEDRRVLRQAAERLAEHLRTYNGVYDIDDGFRRGKEQLDLTLKPAARALGITESDLARQVRNRFFGAEAKREQRGRHELRVYVRLPKSERESEYNIEHMLIRTPNGGEIPLNQAAYIDRGHSYTEIQRKEGGRIVEVTADVDTKVTTGGQVTQNLAEDYMPKLMADYPGLNYEFSGEQQEQRKAMEPLMLGFAIALLVMFGLMAVAFRSYVQPIIVMLAIPFGIVGALGGHLLMGYNLSLISMMGIVALAGVVVNDSLVLISAVNDYRALGASAIEAVASGGARRFRPIWLTSLTTFFGLAPMISERSVQARFLVPMAISLGFGVLFGTFITLVFVPAAYLAVEDVRKLFGKATDKVAEVYED